ncbi:hypothetical protein [Streptomyces sp. NPDC058045]|uniref:hypothetical protein n=1 Tax=Streptomyces sp. NPDC058045 TaxID=3346311 RepID=UPI0036EA3A7C
MTQSGQGDDQRLPSVRPAQEGIVLPADGSEPLMPGAAGAQTTPAGGAPWGEPWGPQGGAPQTAPGGSWGEGQAWDGRQTDGYPQRQPGAHPSQSLPDDAPTGPLPPVTAGPLPGELPGELPGRPPGQDTGGYGSHRAPGAHARPAAPELPGAHAPFANPGMSGMSDPYAAPGSSATPDGYGAGTDGYGIPGGGDSEATQYLDPIASGGPGALPPEAGGPGALPPEAGDQSTTFLGRVPGGRSGAPAPMPGAAPLPGGRIPGAEDSEATQHLPPVPAEPYGVRPGVPGERQPPAEFDSLFRSESDVPASTQQLPRFAPPPDRGHQPGPAEPELPRRRGPSSKVPLLAAAGIGIVVLGVCAGALIGTSGGGDKKKDDRQAVSATAPADSPSPSVDPAKKQAVALDKLLGDSSNSRQSVINAVAAIKSCKNLGKAASDLRAAAGQRNDLVTRLGDIPVDKLPDHNRLTNSLTSAWRASASADSHYAGWADQVGGKHGCHKGQAKYTGQAAAGNKASGEATKAKRQASVLWNRIADRYGLTPRNPTQL